MSIADMNSSKDSLIESERATDVGVNQPCLSDLHDEGWSMIPIKKDKRPCLESWKHYQEKRATSSQINDWDSFYRPSAWAGVTGSVSKRFTLDFDGEKGVATMNKLGLTPHRKTPRGYHVDFDYPSLEVKTLSQSKSALAEAFPGVDVRGEGGYANLLGDSEHGTYLWLVEDRRPHSFTILPADLWALITGNQIAGRKSSLANGHLKSDASGVRSDEGIDQLRIEALDRSRGGRNAAGYWFACRLRESGLGFEEAVLEMLKYQNSCAPESPSGDNHPYTRDEALASLESAWKSEEVQVSVTAKTPEIIVTNRQLPDITADAIAALRNFNAPPTIFMRGGEKVRVQKGCDGRVHIEQMTPDRLKSLLGHSAKWVKVLAGGAVRNVFPNDAVVKDVLVTEWNDFPEIKGIIELPMLRPDGSLLTEAGYDEATGLFLASPPGLVIPQVSDHPTEAEATKARNLLETAIREFPFQDQASRANALALVLSMALRPSIEGLIPMAIITAPRAGSGKSFLVHLASTIASGREAPVSSPPSLRKDDEFRKRVTAAFLADEHLIVLDNVEGRVHSPELDRALSNARWSDRRLGESKNVDLDQHAVWAMTGNNIQLGGD